jgi:hypothetical protein
MVESSGQRPGLSSTLTLVVHLAARQNDHNGDGRYHHKSGFSGSQKARKTQAVANALAS